MAIRHRGPRSHPDVHRVVVPEHDEVSAVAAFLLMTLGPALVMLAWFERRVSTAESADRVRPGAPVLFRAALLRGPRGIAVLLAGA